MDDPRPGHAPRLPARALLVAAALIAAIGAVWYDARSRIGTAQAELASHLRDMEDARAAARQAQESAREAQARLGALEARLAEAQSRQNALEALAQELSRSRDEWQLAEIEQVLAIAQQQLQLSGNLRAAILALQLAEARLARLDRPQFLPVRRALARDLERLRALPTLDLPGLSARLDALVASVDTVPLAFDPRAERSRPEPPAAAAAGEAGFLARFSAEIWSELRQLVVVSRVGPAEPPLLPPVQAYFLRENLKLRLLNARLSLLTRDEAGYREDLRVAQAWLQRYFDPRARQTVAALAQLRQLASSAVSLELPSIVDSLEAVRGVKTRRERGA